MKYLFLTLILNVFMFVSCNTDELPKTFQVGVEEEFKQGEMNQSASSSLEFSITKINDSRCPSDVVCVWEGKVDVTIDIESPQSGMIILSSMDNLVDTVGNFSFELKEVSPYPISTQSVELKDYLVTLEILRIN